MTHAFVCKMQKAKPRTPHSHSPQLQTSCAPLVQKNILAYARDPTVPGVNEIEFPPSVTWDGVQYDGPILYQ